MWIYRHYRHQDRYCRIGFQLKTLMSKKCDSGAFSLENLLRIKQQEYALAKQKAIDEENKRLEEEKKRRAGELARIERERKAEDERLRKEEQARKEEEERRRLEAEKKKEEERLRREAEKERKAAEAKARKEEEERRRLEAEKKKEEERLRREAEKKRKAAEARARKEEEERLKREEAERKKKDENAKKEVAKRKKEEERLKAEALNGTSSGYKYVDLGLPSGLKWATCNVGAPVPENYGKYFSWGETSDKYKYPLESYAFHKKEGLLFKKDVMTKYNEKDGKTVLERDDDVAAVSWKGKWRMPTIEDFRELLDKCKSRWMTVNGVKGRRFTGPNGNSIFIPAAGKYTDEWAPTGRNDFGAYWSSSLYKDKPDRSLYCYFDSSKASDDAYNLRHRGMPVRPVMK